MLLFQLSYNMGKPKLKKQLLKIFSETNLQIFWPNFSKFFVQFLKIFGLRPKIRPSAQQTFGSRSRSRRQQIFGYGRRPSAFSRPLIIVPLLYLGKEKFHILLRLYFSSFVPSKTALNHLPCGNYCTPIVFWKRGI